jgi:hypothetical protein
MFKKLYLLATVLALLSLASGRAGADTLVLSFSGEFGPTSTFNGVALGADTPFSYTATFDTTTGSSPATGIEIFPTVATFVISGIGTFTSVPGSDLYVGLADPTSNTAHDYEAVLTNLAVTQDFGAAYKTATPGFTAADPVPSTLSSLGPIGGKFGLTVEFQGGADLVVNDLPAAGATAVLSLASVPEPTSLMLSGIGLLLGGMAVWRRRTSRCASGN